MRFFFNFRIDSKYNWRVKLDDIISPYEPQESDPAHDCAAVPRRMQPALFPERHAVRHPPSSASLPETDIQKTFPLAPLSLMASPDTYNPTIPSESFIIKSQFSLDTLVKFYAHDLPAQGWSLRYTDANYSGGLTQYWKKDNIYLSMDFGPGTGQVTIHCLFDWVEARFAQKKPGDFPLPGHSEMVKAEETSWELYILQDYAAVTKFYNQKISAMHWKVAPTPEAMLGNCSGSDWVENPSLPPGALPTTTVDPRPVTIWLSACRMEISLT
jgi:hypothetical protein